MVVDDSKVCLKMSEKTLQEHCGADVLCAKSGKMALELLRQDDYHLAKKVNLLLLDLVMPVMSGMHVLRIMKEDDELVDVPVVRLSFF